MWAKRFCGQVAKTLAKVTKNWRSLPLPWVTSQKLQVTLGDLAVTIFVNTFITVTWSHGWTRKPPQLHPPSLSTCPPHSVTGRAFPFWKVDDFCAAGKDKAFCTSHHLSIQSRRNLEIIQIIPLIKSSNIFHHSKKISAHAKTCCWFLDTLRILVGTTPIVAAGFKICFPKFKIMQIGNLPILPLSITYMVFKERLKHWFQFLNSVFITATSEQHCLVEDNSVIIDKVMIITGWPYRNLGK